MLIDDWFRSDFEQLYIKSITETAFYQVKQSQMEGLHAPNRSGEPDPRFYLQ